MVILGCVPVMGYKILPAMQHHSKASWSIGNLAVKDAIFDIDHGQAVLLTLWRPLGFGDFWKKKRLTHMALHGNFSGPVCSTDLVNVLKKTWQVF